LKKISCILGLLLFVAAGCQKESIGVTDEPYEKKEATIHDFVAGLEDSIRDKDMSEFLSYQNKDNEGFYFEQRGWFRNLHFYKDKGYEIKVDVMDAEEVKSESAVVPIRVNVTEPDGTEGDGIIKYKAVFTAGEWQLNDLPFRSMDGSKVSVLYLDGMKERAKTVLLEMEKIIEIFEEHYEFTQDEPLEVKLYKSREQIAMSYSLPTQIPKGVAYGESGIKISMDAIKNNKRERFSLLVHEYSHKMIDQLANDNLNRVLNEGFAKFNDWAYYDAYEKVGYDPFNFEEYGVSTYREHSSFPTVRAMGEFDYWQDNLDMYATGALFFHYLQNEHGVEKWKVFLENLGEHPKPDYTLPVEEIKELKQKRTYQAIEEVYGPLDKLSDSYKAFYQK